MVGFSKKKINSYTLGEKLRHIREDMRISLAEISKSTKIKQSYLEKIEEGDFENLPPDVYVRGFLRSYANYLGVDEEEVVRQYKKECGIKDCIKKMQTVPQKKRLSFPSITVTPRFFTAFSIFAIFFGGFFYFYREIGSFSEEPRLIIMQPSGDLSVDGSNLEIIGITDKDSKVSINDQMVLVNEYGEFRENLGLQNGLNNIKIKSINRFNKEIEKNFNISANYEIKIADAETISQDSGSVLGEKNEGIQLDKVKIEIKVEDSPVWVSVKIDDKDVQSSTMLPGSIQIFEGNDKIAVTSGRANKTFIKFNDKDVGVLSDDPGVVRDVVFNKNTNFNVN